MKFRKITAIALSLCMAAGLLSGCGGKGEKEKDSTKSAGKYVEESVELPSGQGETPFTLLKNAEGELEVYTCHDETGAYSRYVSSDGKNWTQKDASWLSQIYDGMVLNIAAGEDGNNYAIVGEQVEGAGEEGEMPTVIVGDDTDTMWDMKMHLLKQTGEGSAEEISIPELNDAVEQSNPDFYSFGTGLMVMKNGNIVLTGENGAKVYDASDGKLLHTFSYHKSSTDALGTVAVNGGKLALPDEAGTGFDIWDVEKEKDEASISYGSDVRSGKVVLEENDEMYFLDAEGIHHMNPGGTLVETLVEGGSMTMGLPAVYIEGFVKGNADDFYALYTGNQIGIKHYYYDENAKAGSGKKLTIYSLEENDTVRQAVSIFQQKYPDVEVSYKTGDADSSTTKADKIRVLNTELLNKSGADVLVLDDLPVDSFIEKGVLKDISDMINPLIEDGTLKKNIAEAYQQEDGSVYSIPVRYGVPVLYGNQEKIEAMASLDELENWLDAHEGERLVGCTSYENLSYLLVNMYYDELFDESGKLREEKLSQCISCIKKIGERAESDLEDEYVSDETGETIDLFSTGWLAGTGMEDEVNQVTSQEIKSTMDMMIPCSTARENNLQLQFNNNTFVAHGLVGMNSASENTEEAEEFLKILFSDEVQGYDLGDGFPVNQNAEAQITEMGMDSLDDESSMGGVVMIGDGDDSEGSSEPMTFTMPLKTEIEDFLTRAEGLNHPAQADSVLQEMIWEEAKAYYEGSQELEQTIQAVKTKVDTYRAE